MKKIYLITLFVCMPLYGMQQQSTEEKQRAVRTSVVSPAIQEKFKSGSKALQERRWWPAIADLNLVFEFTPDDYILTKAKTAVLLGKAYTMVLEPDLAHHFFMFAANQDANALAKKYALEHMVPHVTSKEKTVAPPQKSPEGSPVKVIQIEPLQKSPTGSPVKEKPCTLLQKDSPVKRSLFKKARVDDNENQ